MWFIVDDRMPSQAKDSLRKYGDIFELKTKGITYETVSGHPDVFVCQAVETGSRSTVSGQGSVYSSRLVISPSVPQELFTWLSERDVEFRQGELPTGSIYPGSASYNAVITDRFIIHNFRYTDPEITRVFDDRDLIHVNQGYCRCNLLPLKEDHFITSDEGIFKVLKRYGMDALLVSPEGIRLPGKKHGFFGGACGVLGDRVLICGSLDSLTQGKRIRDYLQTIEYQIIELYDGPLFDTGSILAGVTL